MKPNKEIDNEALAESFGFLFGKATQKTVEACQLELSRLSLNTREIGLLKTIKHYSPITQKQAGKLLRVDRTTMVALVDSLESRNYLSRSIDAKDRRNNNLVLTKEGEQALEKGWTTVQRGETAALKMLSKTEKETLSMLLNKILGSE